MPLRFRFRLPVVAVTFGRIFPPAFKADGRSWLSRIVIREMLGKPFDCIGDTQVIQRAALWAFAEWHRHILAASALPFDGFIMQIR
jgi:hypothetical protein